MFLPLPTNSIVPRKWMRLRWSVPAPPPPLRTLHSSPQSPSPSGLLQVDGPGGGGKEGSGTHTH